MELGSINDKLIRNLQRAQTEQTMTVSKTLGLAVGTPFLANVQKASQITPEERAQLVTSIDAKLAQLNKASSSPATKALINELEAQKNIAQAANVKIVTLSINAPTATNPAAPPASTPNPSTTPPVTGNQSLPMTTRLLTYTNQPLQVGQTLLMQLSENQRLQLLQPLAKTSIAASAMAQTLINTSFTSNALLTEGAALERAIGMVQQNKLAAMNNATVIGDSLRLLLPHKDNKQNLLTNLPKLVQFIQELPSAERKEWISNHVQQSLNTLANHIHRSDQLTNPKFLEQALNNNGQQFEQKLAQLALGQKNGEVSITPAAAHFSSLANSTASVNGLNSTAATLSPMAKLATQSPSANKSAVVQQVSVEKMAAQDLKGVLLGLLHQLDGELETTSAALPGAPLTNELNKHLVATTLPQLLGMLANKQAGELSQKHLRTQLVMLIHQYTLGSIAKIQLQQTHSLNHQLSQADQAQPSQSWQFELPVRQGQDVNPLHIHIEQRWIDEENAAAAQNNARVRQWNVMLSFDLPVIGQFYAQLTLVGNSLSAKFWADNESTLRDAKNNLASLTSRLERDGIQVTQIQCVPGVPPKPKMSLSYSLVDIKT